MTNYFHLCIFSLGAVFFSCKKEAEQAIQPKKENISESVYASGIIKSQNQYQVFATVSGLLKEIMVKEGDVVKKGSPLFIPVSYTHLKYWVMLKMISSIHQTGLSISGKM